MFPTATLTPSVTPTATLAPTATPTPTRTLTVAESRAAQRRAFAGYTWRAEGNTITLVDAQGTPVATLDEKAGGVVFSNSDAINSLLFVPDGKGGYTAGSDG